MYAIRTKYFGPNEVRGSRIKATVHPSKLASITIPYPADVRMGREAHFVAVLALLNERKPDWVPALGWVEDACIATEDGSGFFFINVGG